MTVKELAQELNATVPEIFEHYQKIMVKIPEDENYELNEDLVKRAIPNYSEKKLKSNQL
jgi:vacuolar-type H+-ATPase subunit F/Vma7